MIESGSYSRHVAKLRAVYREKSELMLKSLSREFADLPGVRWTNPAGGLYVWLTFPANIDTGPSGPLVSAALAAGVLYVPGEFGHVRMKRAASREMRSA